MSEQPFGTNSYLKNLIQEKQHQRIFTVLRSKIEFPLGKFKVKMCSVEARRKGGLQCVVEIRGFENPSVLFLTFGKLQQTA